MFVHIKKLVSVRIRRLLAVAVLAVAPVCPASANLICDVDANGVIDMADIYAIVAARNKPASGPGDVRDADGNGKINALDVRTCQVRCTRPQCSTQNLPPSANAGSDQTMPVGAIVHLSGAASNDPDGPNTLGYSWTFTDKPTGSVAALANANTVGPTFTIDHPGSYRLHLVVNDGLANSAPDEVIISTTNSAPTANAGPDQTGHVLERVDLSGAASSDPDGDTLNYAWSFDTKPAGSTAVLAHANTVSASFVIDLPGQYLVRLTVSDGSAQASDTLQVTTTNTAPVANAGPDQSTAVGNTVTLDGTGSTDIDRDPLVYAWTLSSSPMHSTARLLPPGSATPSFVADKPGSYTAQLVVNDGFTNSNPDAVVITTGNTAPVAHIQATCAATIDTDCSVAIGSAVTIDGSPSTDVDRDLLTYRWSLAGRPAGASATLTPATELSTRLTTDVPGDFVVQLIVRDGRIDSLARTIKITSTNVKPIAMATIAPASIAILPTTVQLDGGQSTDLEGRSLTYAWSLSKPTGSAALLSNASVAAPNFIADIVGTYTAQLIVHDGFLASTPVTVSASTANQPPVARAGSDQSVVAGGTVTLNGSASSDPEGSALSYFWSFTTRPTGSSAAFDDNIAAGPHFVADKKGSYVAQLIVNDGTLDSAPDTVAITATNRAPIASADSFSMSQGGTLTVGDGAGVLANDSDPDDDALTASISGGVPPGLTFNASGGFGYTPDPAFSGTTTFQYKANDGSADSNTVTVTIVVTAGPPVQSPAAIHGNVYADIDNDGIQDAGEYGIGNVTVTLSGTDDLGQTVRLTATTAELSGFYLFGNLRPGTYTLSETQPAGYQDGKDSAGTAGGTVSDDRIANIVLIAGQSSQGNNFGEIPQTSLGGRVWLDTNGNGIQDTGEPGINGVIVQLYDVNDHHVQTITTANDATGNPGHYVFYALNAMRYHLGFVPPAGSVFTRQDAGDDAKDSDAYTLASDYYAVGRTDPIDLTAGESQLTWDAGLVGPASIGDRVWQDTNGDGIQDSDESGKPGVTVRLYDCVIGQPYHFLATTTSNGTGTYSFANLSPGEYLLGFISNDNNLHSPAKQGTDENIDSDAGVTEDRTTCFTLAAGENKTTVDAGFKETGHLDVFASLVPLGGTAQAAVAMSVNPGQVINVTLTSSPAGVLDIPAMVTVEDSGWAYFNIGGRGLGSATITASVPGYDDSTVLATVTTTDKMIDSIYDGGFVGRDLQYSESIQLRSPAPVGGVRVTLTSSDPTRLLLAAGYNPTTVGSGSITLDIPEGYVSAQYAVQALTDNGKVQVTVSAPGYTDFSDSYRLTPSGFILSPASFGTTAGAPAISMTACLVALSPDRLETWSGNIPMRPGAAPVSLGIASSNPAVGRIDGSPATLQPGEACTDPTAMRFVPLSVGTTRLDLIQPAGYPKLLDDRQSTGVTVR